MRKAITTTTITTNRGRLSTPGNPILHWPTSSSPPPPPQNPSSNPPENPSDVIKSLCSSNSFASAWAHILSSLPLPLSSFAPLLRRYSRAHMPSSAIRTFLYLRSHPHSFIPDTDTDTDSALNLLLDSLCKERHVTTALSFSSSLPKPLPLVSSNILLHGLLRARKLSRARKLFDEMPQRNVVTYGTLIEGLSRMRRPDEALSLLERMRLDEPFAPNHATCNPVVDSLAEAARFSEALSLVEKFPLFGISPNEYTYNSLVKGFCKHGDLVGASKVLKTMIARDVLPSARTYNYFFKHFAKHEKVEEGMSLYEKLVSSGYALERLTYHLLVKMLCESEKLDLAVGMVRAMNAHGFDSDLATSTMVLHLLIRMKRIDEACTDFEKMVEKGIVPQYVTFRMLAKELRRMGMGEMERRISGLMDSLPHSTKLPGSYREREGDEVVGLRRSIMKKARSMSETLKTCKDPKELRKLNGSTESAVNTANKMIDDIKRRVYKVKDG